MGRTVLLPHVSVGEGFVLPVPGEPIVLGAPRHAPRISPDIWGDAAHPSVAPMLCTRVFGDAPSRRFVYERRGMGVGITSDPNDDFHGATGAVQLILYEGTQVIDVAYRAFVNVVGVPRQLVVAPRIQLDERVVEAPATRIRDGTVIRFMPR